jgi:uncharacterized membrane protein YeaQ/YmgE (transglycosylase-associated protein family)
MQNMIVWVVLGALIGLAASFVMRTNVGPALRANILVGIAGAVFAGLVLSPLFRYSPLSPVLFSIPAMLMAILGAMVLVPTVHLVRQSYRR